MLMRKKFTALLILDEVHHENVSHVNAYFSYEQPFFIIFTGNTEGTKYWTESIKNLNS